MSIGDTLAADGSYERTSDGVVVTPASGPAKLVRLQVMSDRIVRVTAVPTASLTVPQSLMVVAAPAKTNFSIVTPAGKVIVKTAQVSAEVLLATGVVSFLHAQGKAVLTERDRGRFEPATADGKPFYRVQQVFNPGTDEAFYGLGQHQNAQMNYNGEDVELAQHNMDIAVPFVLSSRNYGVLWDSNSITRFGNPRVYGLASRDLTLYDADGKKGGLTASYFIDGALKVKRVEKDVNYQFIRDLAAWPQQLLGTTVSNTSAMRMQLPGQTVTWEGKMESAVTGVHKFQLFAGSYFKLYADGKLIRDGWRQNWNAWYHNFELPMSAGKPVALKVEWTPDDGHIALLHNDPLPDAERHSLSLTSDTTRAIDYYYIAGANLDEVIAGYRQLTGKAVLLPRWAYGFWQSRQRYNTQAEVLDIVKEYRRRKLPIDNIVQDWFYWPENAWGSHDFDATRFPDPKGLIDQLHAQHARFMISVWPKFYPTTRNYQELDAKGYIYRRNVDLGIKDWVGPGYLNAHYDPYAQEARDIYWRQIETKLKSLGVDAWWLDNTEPDVHSNLDREELIKRIGPTAIGPAAQYFNSYPLMQSRSVYEGERRSSTPDKRVFILTRSGFAGLQRYGAATWSGDIASRWDDLYDQISAGVSIGYAGLPNWTFDIGGFANEGRYSTQKPTAADQEEWRELNLRWFQFGAFAPLFRSHGEYPFREIFNLAPQGSEVFNSLVWHDKLRYRLLPYTYTVAADTFHRDGTIMRGLTMDFMDDKAAREVKDEYLYGKAFLVAPVHTYRARSRPVYLPAGVDWYDFHTGAVAKGGMTVDAAAPLGRMPLYVRTGSIVPVGPDIQYTAEKPGAPLTLLVFTGADGDFDLYEDDGVSYGYEKGEFSRIPLRYDAAKGTLTIGERAGSYPGMVEERTFNVRWIKAGAAAPADLDAKPDATVQYKGAAVTLN